MRRILKPRDPEQRVLSRPKTFIFMITDFKCINRILKINVTITNFRKIMGITTIININININHDLKIMTVVINNKNINNDLASIIMKIVVVYIMMMLNQKHQSHELHKLSALLCTYITHTDMNTHIHKYSHTIKYNLIIIILYII